MLGVTFGKQKGDRETWWWNEVQKSIKEKNEAKKAWDKIQMKILKRSTKKRRVRQRRQLQFFAKKADAVLIPIYKNKGDAQCCGNYRGIKLMSHTMKVWERIMEARLRDRVEITKQQYGFMPGKGTTDCFKNVDGKIQGRSKRPSLCICEPRESL